MAPSNPWLEGSGARGAEYDERFDRLRAAGVDVHGEADLVVSLGVRTVLDAGCGTGRVAVELARRGLDVMGVDLDDAMLDAARKKAPGLTWVLDDVATVRLERRFDLVLMAGNVLLFVAPGDEAATVANLSTHLVPEGLLLAGFSLRPGGLRVEHYDEMATAAGLRLVDRWATWDRRPFTERDDYAVSLHRASADLVSR